jgi:hypothetical protein
MRGIIGARDQPDIEPLLGQIAQGLFLALSARLAPGKVVAGQLRDAGEQLLLQPGIVMRRGSRQRLAHHGDHRHSGQGSTA